MYLRSQPNDQFPPVEPHLLLIGPKERYALQLCGYQHSSVDRFVHALSERKFQSLRQEVPVY
jgi:hypothetical protein